MSLRKNTAKLAIAALMAASPLGYSEGESGGDWGAGEGMMMMNMAGSIAQSATKGKTSQILGGAMNSAMATVFWRRYKKTDWKIYAVMAIGSGVQAGLSLTASGKSEGVRSAATSGGDWGIAPEGMGTDLFLPGNKALNDSMKEVSQIFKELKNEGFKINDDGTVTTPDGVTIGMAEAGTAAGMEKLGMSPSEISSTLAAVGGLAKEAAKKGAAMVGVDAANVVSIGIDGGAGGYRGPASLDLEEGEDRSGFNLEDYMKRLRRGSPEQKAQMLAGKSMSHGEDQIGVSQADIFTMVHRRYQEKRAGGEFIEPITAAPKKNGR